jgi:hypothetical protein
MREHYPKSPDGSVSGICPRAAVHFRIRFVLFSRRCPVTPPINIVSITTSHERKELQNGNRSLFPH